MIELHDDDHDRPHVAQCDFCPDSIPKYFLKLPVSISRLLIRGMLNSDDFQLVNHKADVADWKFTIVFKNQDKTTRQRLLTGSSL